MYILNIFISKTLLLSSEDIEGDLSLLLCTQHEHTLLIISHLKEKITFISMVTALVAELRRDILERKLSFDAAEEPSSSIIHERRQISQRASSLRGLFFSLKFIQTQTPTP